MSHLLGEFGSLHFKNDLPTASFAVSIEKEASSTARTRKVI